MSRASVMGDDDRGDSGDQAHDSEVEPQLLLALRISGAQFSLPTLGERSPHERARPAVEHPLVDPPFKSKFKKWCANQWACQRVIA